MRIRLVYQDGTWVNGVENTPSINTPTRIEYGCVTFAFQYCAKDGIAVYLEERNAVSIDETFTMEENDV